MEWDGRGLGGEFGEALDATRSGDRDAFSVIWRALHPGLLRYLRGIAGEAAEDLAADTWLEVARRLDHFQGDEDGFRGWVFTIARHRHLDYCRRQARRPVASTMVDFVDRPGGENVAEAVEAVFSTQDALDLIATLPPDQAEAVMLRIVGDLDVARVALIMGRAPGAVRVLTHRGLHRLAERLGAPTLKAQPDPQPVLAPPALPEEELAVA